MSFCGFWAACVNPALVKSFFLVCDAARQVRLFDTSSMEFWCEFPWRVAKMKMSILAGRNRNTMFRVLLSCSNPSLALPLYRGCHPVFFFLRLPYAHTCSHSCTFKFRALGQLESHRQSRRAEAKGTPIRAKCRRRQHAFVGWLL